MRKLRLPSLLVVAVSGAAMMLGTSCKHRLPASEAKALEGNSGATEASTPSLLWHVSQPGALLEMRQSFVSEMDEATVRSTVSLFGFGDSEKARTTTQPNGFIQVPIDLAVSLSGGGTQCQSGGPRGRTTGCGTVNVWGSAKVQKNVWLFPSGVTTTAAELTSQPVVQETHSTSGSGRFAGIAARRAEGPTAAAAQRAYQQAYEGLRTQPKLELDRQVDPLIGQAQATYKEYNPMANLQEDFDVFLRSVPKQAMVCIFDKSRTKGQYQSCPVISNEGHWSVKLSAKDEMLGQLARANLGGKEVPLEKLRLQFCQDQLNFPVEFCNRSNAKKELTRTLTFADAEPVKASFGSDKVVLTLDVFVKNLPFNAQTATAPLLAVNERLPIPDLSTDGVVMLDRGQILALAGDEASLPTETSEAGEESNSQTAAGGKGFNVQIAVTYAVTGTNLKRESILVDPKSLPEPKSAEERAFHLAALSQLDAAGLDAFFKDVAAGVEDVNEQIRLREEAGTLQSDVSAVLSQLKAGGGGGQGFNPIASLLGGLASLQEFHKTMEELKSVFAEEVNGPSLPLFVTAGVHKLTAWQARDGVMSATWQACKRDQLGLGVDIAAVPSADRPGYNYIRIAKIYPGLPADKAGLKVNDFISEVEGQHYGTVPAFQFGINNLSTRSPARPIRIKAVRSANGKFQEADFDVSLRAICP